ncbi:nitrate reductase molybdenum cofactor assembly chaperone [Actinospica sp. MGRD01-02]|uniref:Nitrate reductase molybdenum cofactor assembly chaperone n=1 Tax=Actinospica acidithermotolerans TaxID=2828514 RepID=A0A941IJT3_9ACTN|nr:nitrate reductase molybdenum cofactor assembly chaperone [Actinospica acidithermotolerans]MBR7829814.1 nitrate reductase molybdenum cofactor assembly chaperone [Actinospica acidithermotolerans]
MRLAVRARRQADARSVALIRKAASICLSYPGIGFPIQLALVERAVEELDDAAAEPFRRFTGYAASLDPYDLASAYVETFDQGDRALLHLTRWRAGDTANRGEEIVKFITAYREAGYEYGGEELPDHLPVVLDFASCAGDRASEVGGALLAEYRGALVKLHESLERAGGREEYARHAAELVEAVLRTLPETTPGSSSAETSRP